MRANDRRGCAADGALRVARLTQGRGTAPTITGVLPLAQGRGGAESNNTANTMNQRLVTDTERDVGVILAAPKRPVDTGTNGARYPRCRWGEDSSISGSGARLATCTTVPEEGREVSREKSKGREVDALLLKADHRGAYKRFLVWGWLVPVCFLIPCAHLNFKLMVYLPPSNCTLPEPPQNVTNDAWRKLVTPRSVPWF